MRRLLLIVGLLALAMPLAAQTLAPGQYTRNEGDLRHLLELRTDGTGTAVTQNPDGSYQIIMRFDWKVDGG